MNWRNVAVAGAVGLGVAAVLLRRKSVPVQGQVVVITGGSRGLGLALAREYTRRGAALALVARDRAELDRAAGELRAMGAEVSVWPVDLIQGNGCEVVLAEIAERHGQIDVLINNAGEIVVGPFETFTHDDFHRSLAIHLWAPLRLTQAALPIMRRRGGGRIANIASIGGKIPVPHLSAYCTGKFALVGFSGTMRAELAQQGISVTTVCPGLMRTGSHWNAWFKGRREAEFAWFGHGASLPGISIAAERAARQIVNAVQRGDSELLVTWQAQAAACLATLLPSVFSGMNALVARFLPPMPEDGDSAAARGWDSRSKWMPSFFTRLGDQAALRNNELAGHDRPV